MNILRVDSAVTGPDSVSRELTQAITDHFRALHPEARVVELDITKFTNGRIGSCGQQDKSQSDAPHDRTGNDGGRRC